MKRPPLGPGGKDITWRPAGERRLIPETSNLKPQTSNQEDTRVCTQVG